MKNKERKNTGKGSKQKSRRREIYREGLGWIWDCSIFLWGEGGTNNEKIGINHPPLTPRAHTRTGRGTLHTIILETERKRERGVRCNDFSTM